MKCPQTVKRKCCPPVEQCVRQSACDWAVVRCARLEWRTLSLQTLANTTTPSKHHRLQPVSGPSLSQQSISVSDASYSRVCLSVYLPYIWLICVYITGAKRQRRLRALSYKRCMTVVCYSWNLAWGNYSHACLSFKLGCRARIHFEEDSYRNVCLVPLMSRTM